VEKLLEIWGWWKYGIPQPEILTSFVKEVIYPEAYVEKLEVTFQPGYPYLVK